tara:strand:- start:38 stop:514 length:477 start_codon:yes stop_codon:yes gene_type:complete
MHHKQNNKESKSYVQGLRLFGNTLPNGVKGILKKNGYNYSEIISKWNKLVGSNISNCSYPKSIKMQKGNKNGILLVCVKRGDEITVEFSKKDIINKINSYFGYELIGNLKLQTFSEKKEIIKNKNMKKNYSKFENKINKIKSEKIRNSLSELLYAVKK